MAGYSHGGGNTVRGSPYFSSGKVFRSCFWFRICPTRGSLLPLFCGLLFKRFQLFGHRQGSEGIPARTIAAEF